MSVPTHICTGNVTADPEIDSEWVTEHEQFDPVVIPNPDNMLDPESPALSDAEGDIMSIGSNDNQDNQGLSNADLEEEEEEDADEDEIQHIYPARSHRNRQVQHDGSAYDIFSLDPSKSSSYAVIQHHAAIHKTGKAMPTRITHVQNRDSEEPAERPLPTQIGRPRLISSMEPWRSTANLVGSSRQHRMQAETVKFPVITGRRMGRVDTLESLEATESISAKRRDTHDIEFHDNQGRSTSKDKGKTKARLSHVQLQNIEQDSLHPSSKSGKESAPPRTKRAIPLT